MSYLMCEAPHLTKNYAELASVLDRSGAMESSRFLTAKRLLAADGWAAVRTADLPREQVVTGAYLN